MIMTILKMDKEEVRKLITGLKVWKRGDQRAPHKPLLLLYALGRCLRGQDRLISYETVNGLCSMACQGGFQRICQGGVRLLLLRVPDNK